MQNWKAFHSSKKPLSSFPAHPFFSFSPRLSSLSPLLLLSPAYLLALPTHLSSGVTSHSCKLYWNRISNPLLTKRRDGTKISDLNYRSFPPLLPVSLLSVSLMLSLSLACVCVWAQPVLKLKVSFLCMCLSVCVWCLGCTHARVCTLTCCVCDREMQLAAQLDRGGYDWSWIEWLAGSSIAAGNTNVTHTHTFIAFLQISTLIGKHTHSYINTCMWSHTNSGSCRRHTSTQHPSIRISTVWMIHSERCQNTAIFNHTCTRAHTHTQKNTYRHSHTESGSLNRHTHTRELKEKKVFHFKPLLLEGLRVQSNTKAELPDIKHACEGPAGSPAKLGWEQAEHLSLLEEDI